jgi:hypothetical protein
MARKSFSNHHNNSELALAGPERVAKITTRSAEMADVEEMVNIDLKAFSSVYSNYGKDEDELRAELREKFTHRMELVGGQFIKVAERDGEMVGFIACCPTSENPENFRSWEESTNNGTLNGTYDPNGKNLYIVSLSMIAKGSAELAQNMLFGNILSELIKGDFDLAYFESRVPGLRRWMRNQSKILGLEFSSLSDSQKDEFARQYFMLKKEKDGKLVPKDKLLEIYDSAGCRFVDIYRDAYQDELSMNYGVLAIFDNPMPERARKIPVVRKLASIAIAGAAKSNYLMGKYF